MIMTALPRWESSRHSTALAETAYLGDAGRLAFNVQSRGEMRRVVRQWLRVARTPEEKRRVMNVWRHIHYLGKGGGAVFPPRTIRLHYYLDMPALRPVPHPWYPAAAVTIRYALPAGIPPLLSFSDPAVGHDGGLYRGAGAQYLGQLPGGKEVWGWPLTQEVIACHR